MSISTRELYLALRVRDEGTRNMQRFAQELVRTGTMARIASLKAQADQLREQAQLVRQSAAIERSAATRLRDSGASMAQVRAAQAHANALTREANELSASATQLDRQATAIQRNAQRLGHLTNTLTQTGVALETVGVAFGFLGAAGVAAMNMTLDVAVEYQRQVRATATQVDGFGASLQELHDIGIRVAKNIAVPFQEIQPALFDIFSSLEIGTTDAGLLLEKFAKAAVAGQTDIQSASRATIGIMNAFNIPLEDVNHLLDLQFQLVQEGIGSYEEWNARIGQVSPSAVRAGQSIETMLAALATTTRFGIPAARASTAVARAFDAMSNPKAIEDMEELGIKVREADGSIRPFNLVMREFRDVLNKMPEKDRVGAILEVFKGAGSTIEARKFLQSILLGEQGLELFDTVLNEMNADTGSFTRAYEMMADTTASRSQIMTNKWNVMKEAIGEQLLPVLDKLLGFLGGLLDKFDALSPETKKTIAQWLLWGSAAAIVIGVVLTFIGILAVFIASVVAAGSVLGVTLLVISGVGAVLTALGASFIAAWQNSETFRDGVKSGFEQFKQFGQAVRDTASGLVQAFNDHMLPALQKVWAFIDEKVLPQLIEFRDQVWNKIYPVIKETGVILVNIAEFAFKHLGDVIKNDILPILKQMSEWWERNKTTLMPIVHILAQVAKWFIIVAAVIVSVVVVAMLGILVVAILAVVGAFIAVVEIVQAVWRALVWFWQHVLVPVGTAIYEFGATIQQTMREAGESVWGFLRNIWNNIMGFKDTLVQAGRDLIQGFADGIQDKFGSVLGVIRNLGGAVISTLKSILGISSPSKETFKLGVQSAQGYINGYKRTMSDAMFGANDFFGTNPRSMMLPSNVQGRVGFDSGQSGPSTPMNDDRKTINNNITINTTEMVPREVAAQLGWELSGRM